VLLKNGGMLFMPPFFSQHHAVLNKKLRIPRFYSRLPAQLSFFHAAAFCSFTLCIFHPTFNFYHAAFLFITRTLF
jgi:hypothetical protein